ncbi:hypothetical protein BGZ83_009187 [Gryganskiella cystojenkinii]|nr:hypothetical protein BGZ83_009187 [Gryganskiella cystojenkinii]
MKFNVALSLASLAVLLSVSALPTTQPEAAEAEYAANIRLVSGAVLKVVASGKSALMLVDLLSAVMLVAASPTIAKAVFRKIWDERTHDFSLKGSAQNQLFFNLRVTKHREMSSSPKLVLYASKVCPYAARAILAMAETNQAHERVEIDLSVPRPDWFIKDINPYGQVPALKVDDKNVILESMFVAEYIVDLNPQAGLMPQDPLQRAQSRYLIHHWGAHTQPAFTKAAFSLEAATASERHQTWLRELERIDELLLEAKKTSDGPFFLGDKFTFADMSLASFLTRVFLVEHFQGEGSFGFKFPVSSPKLKRFLEWRDAVVARKSVVETLPNKEELAQLHQKFVK